MESQACNFGEMSGASSGLRVGSLFSGIGGIELGLSTSGFRTAFFCESWDPARAVLADRFEGVPIMDDVREVRSIPSVDVLTAGFPCSDLSQAGRMAGIAGPQSGLITEVFRLLHGQGVPTVVFENVRNMLSLHRGKAMRLITCELEELGYHWAYRVVDSRFSGVPHRRQRVILVASRTIDPRAVLHVDDAGEPSDDYFRDDAFGFYWTEGSRGLGWARDATPALKNGSTLGLASPPAIWNPAGSDGHRIVLPRIEDGERLQGFPVRWTRAASTRCSQKGTRWRLVGNAVTVGVARWLGRRLVNPVGRPASGDAHDVDRPWPLAGYGDNGTVYGVDLSMWPRRYEYKHLSQLVDLESAAPLSTRATGGFHARATNSNLAFDPRFLHDVADHLTHLAA